MAWDHDGKSRHERGYGSAWDKARLPALERDGNLCVRCGRVARCVDHITPKAKADADGMLVHNGKRMHMHSLENLQSLCFPCHDVKTRTEDTGRAHRRKVSIGLDGWPED